MNLRKLIHVLEQVEANPEYPLILGRFVKWDNSVLEDRTLIGACPLTQVALKTGLRYEGLQKAEYPADYICDFLAHEFAMDTEDAAFVWRKYDDGIPLLEIIAHLEVKSSDENPT